MERAEQIKEEIKNIYKEGEWDWFFLFHVDVVAQFSREIAKRENANEELCFLAALFHDIARAWGIFKEPELMDVSLEKAEELMKKAGYSPKDVETVKDAIIPHSCYGLPPKTLEGKVLSTADALAHLMTDFYLAMPTKLEEIREMRTFKPWARKKIERDFWKKIAFDEDRKRARSRYEALRVMLE